MDALETHLNYIKETFNIGVERGANILNTMLNSPIKLNVPEIKIIDKIDNSIITESNQPIATVELPFHGELSGNCKLLFPIESALKLVQDASGDLGGNMEAEFDSISEGVLKEIGNVVLNSVIGILCNNLKIQLKYSVPVFNQNKREEILKSTFSSDGTTGVFARIHFSIESINVQGDVMTVFKMGSFSKLLNLIDEHIDD